MVESHDAAVEMRELNTLEKIDWREYLENYSNNWQDNLGRLRRRRSAPGGREHAEPQDLARRSPDVAVAAVTACAKTKSGSAPPSSTTSTTTVIWRLRWKTWRRSLNATSTRWKRCCASVQRLDPPGVAARDLKECLLPAARQPRDGGFARRADREIASGVARKASLRRNRQGHRSLGAIGIPGGQGHLAARAQTGARLRRPGSGLHRSRRGNSQDGRRIRGGAQRRSGAAAAPVGLLPAGAA